MDFQSIVETNLAKFTQTHVAPYVVGAVCQDGHLLAASSCNAAGFGELVDPGGTAFRIASMTKSFAAAATLRLRDRGSCGLRHAWRSMCRSCGWTGRGGG